MQHELSSGAQSKQSFRHFKRPFRFIHDQHAISRTRVDGLADRTAMDALARYQPTRASLPLFLLPVPAVPPPGPRSFTAPDFLFRRSSQR